jgi:hypothetical protein
MEVFTQDFTFLIHDVEARRPLIVEKGIEPLMISSVKPLEIKPIVRSYDYEPNQETANKDFCNQQNPIHHGRIGLKKYVLVRTA